MKTSILNLTTFYSPEFNGLFKVHNVLDNEWYECGQMCNFYNDCRTNTELFLVHHSIIDASISLGKKAVSKVLKEYLIIDEAFRAARKSEGNWSTNVGIRIKEYNGVRDWPENDSRIYKVDRYKKTKLVKS